MATKKTEVDCGSEIRKARKKCGLTQPRLSELCGWSGNNSRISQYERNQREPTLADLRKIQCVLGADFSHLLSPSSSPPRNDGRYGVTDEPDLPFGGVPFHDWTLDLRMPPPDNAPKIICPEPHSRSTFALPVRDYEMAPDYVAGDTIFIDPNVEARHGDDVIVANGEIGGVLRRVEFTRNGAQLVTLGAVRNRSTPLEDPNAILRVVIGTYRPNKRLRHS